MNPSAAAKAAAAWVDRKSKGSLEQPQILHRCRVITAAHSTTAATAGACPPNSVHSECSHADNQATVCRSHKAHAGGAHHPTTCPTCSTCTAPKTP
jgi:hypothetical protein